MKSRFVYVATSVVLFMVCYVIVLSFDGQPFIRGFLGDVIIITLMYTVIKSFFTKLNSIKLCISLLLFAYAVETMQYFRLVELLGLGNYKLARIVIGTSFDAMDLLAYTIGFFLTLYLDRQNKRLMEQKSTRI
jgi:hypothetical protein